MNRRDFLERMGMAGLVAVPFVRRIFPVVGVPWQCPISGTERMMLATEGHRLRDFYGTSTGSRSDRIVMDLIERVRRKSVVPNLLTVGDPRIMRFSEIRL